MKLRKEIGEGVRGIYVLPFVQGCQPQCLCLVCSFGSRWLWTTEPGSVWRIPPDAPEPLPGEGRPRRDHCCDGHGAAYLWESTGDNRGRKRRLEDSHFNQSDAKLSTPGTFFTSVRTKTLFWNTTSQQTHEQSESHLLLILCLIRVSKRSHGIV